MPFLWPIRNPDNKKLRVQEWKSDGDRRMLTALEKRVGTTLPPMRFLPAQLSHLTARGLAFAQCTTSDAAARYHPPRPPDHDHTYHS